MEKWPEKAIILWTFGKYYIIIFYDSNILTSDSMTSKDLGRGGEQMVEETIRTIKETENEAEGIIKKADAACTEILDNAKAEAAEMVGRAEAEAKSEAAAALEAAKEAGRKSEQEAMDSVEKEIATLKKDALAKESEVVSAVIEELV